MEKDFVRIEEMEEMPARQGRLSDYSFGMCNGYLMSKDLECEIISGIEDTIDNGTANASYHAGFATVDYAFQLDWDEEKDCEAIFVDMIIKVFNDHGQDYELIKCYRFTVDDDFWSWAPGYLSGEFFRACLALEYQEEIFKD